MTEGATIIAAACAVALGLGMAGQTSLAETIVLDPIADALVAASKPENNYGGGGALSVAATANGEFQTLLRFDASSAQSAFDAAWGGGQWKISGLTLRLVSNNVANPLFGAPAAGTIRVLTMANDGWQEGAGTPNAPTADGVTFAALAGLLSVGDALLGDFSVVAAAPTTYDLALSAGSSVDAKIAAGGLFALRVAPADDQVTIHFGSRTNLNGSLRPSLAVHAVAVPEPASLGFAVCSLAALAVLPRSRRSARGDGPR